MRCLAAIPLAAFTPIGLLFLTACGSAHIEQMQTEIHGLHDEIEELKRSQAAWRVQFDGLRQRVVVMEDKTDTDRVNRARRDDTWIPKLPTVKVQRPSEVAVARVAEPLPTVAATGGGPADDLPPQDEPRPRADDPVSQYEHAKAALDQDQLPAARLQFERLLEQYPKHDLADNALYWLGESYRRQALWLKAAQYYLRVVQSYPKANKVPDSLLQLGGCYREMGEDGNSSEVWQQLLDKYPNESAAKSAAKRLAELKRKAP